MVPKKSSLPISIRAASPILQVKLFSQMSVKIAQGMAQRGAPSQFGAELAAIGDSHSDQPASDQVFILLRRRARSSLSTMMWMRFQPRHFKG